MLRIRPVYGLSVFYTFKLVTVDRIHWPTFRNTGPNNRETHEGYQMASM